MNLQQHTENTLALMRRQGFDDAMVEASAHTLAELNVAHDEPALMRSTERHKLSLLGLLDGRRASTEIGDLSDGAVARAVADLLAAARSAPQDDANAVSSGQLADLQQGPMAADPAAMADSMADLLDWRAAHTPSVTLEEAMVSHHQRRAHTATSGGSSLASRLGWYELMAMATAREDDQSSSFNYAGGSCHALGGQPTAQCFGIGSMLGDLSRQVHTRALTERFTGDVVLMPQAVDSLLGWLRGQLADLALISGTSLYRDQVGTAIASPLLGLKSRFDAPGVAALSVDGFVAPPVELLREGRLLTLTPSLYGSRKTGLPHVPLAAAGWELAAGTTPLAEVVAGVPRGAVVGRLSMGMPAANGNFSGVIKNSFLIEGGRVGTALSEVMVSGNMAQMLRDVVAVSAERLDTGDTLLPWVRIAGLHFS
jgi:PmbA protein